MGSQTPPSDGMYAKLDQIHREIFRKREIDGRTLQHIMDCPDFTERVERVYVDMAADFRRSPPLIERPPVATIRVGTYQDVEAWCQSILGAGCRIGDWANDLTDQRGAVGEVGKFYLVSEMAEIPLYAASNADLGYPKGCTVAESFAALEGIGAKKLPPDGMLYLRLAYLNQPLGEWLLGYMDPIADSSGDPEVFYVGRNEDGLWLYSSFAHPENTYSGGAVWVFARE
jgi:hypothetical protein